MKKGRLATPSVHLAAFEAAGAGVRGAAFFTYMSNQRTIS
jgi:hypothetical protein